MNQYSHPARRGHDTLRRLTLSAMFLAIGIILPFFTGQIQEIGKMLLPMHIPVLLCGLICGWQYGGAVGIILPLMRSMMFGMPPIYPTALGMSIELATYGLSIGLIYACMRKQHVGSVYIALIPAMLIGRAIWGVSQVLLLGMQDNKFTWNAFLAAAFLNALPGIILQLVLIPAVMTLLHISGLWRFCGKGDVT